MTGSRQETSGELAAAFATWAGSEPEGVWSAPGRVTLLGEYLDLCGGVVLPTTIDLRARVALRRRPDRLFRVRSRQRQEVVEVETQELEPGVVSGWAAYLLGAIWAMLELGGSAVGMDVMLDSRLPEGAGVSSSAAIECALVEALSTSWKMGLSSWQKAMAARRAEADFVGVPCGLMDQVAAVFGKPACALRFDTAAKTVDYLPLDLRAKGAQLFLLDTNTRRQVGASAYPARRAALERALGELRGASPAGGRQADLRLAGDLSESPLLRHAATEQRRVDEGAQALQRGEFERLGRLMSSSHESLSHDLQVSGPELDLGVQAACAGGAYGAKLTGAGFAGAVVAIGPRWAGPQIRRSVAAAFTARGLRPAVVRAVEPTAGARQDS